MPNMKTKLVGIEVLREFSTRVFLHFGCPKEDAEQAADVLSSGASIPMAWLGCTAMSKCSVLDELIQKPRIEIVRSSLSTATVDGDNGLGLVVAPMANCIAMDMVEKSGSGLVSVRNTNHFGIAGYYVLKALERDLIGWAMTNSTKLVAPLWGANRSAPTASTGDIRATASWLC